MGIIGISILTTVLIFKYGWNVPKVASIDLFIGYLLVMFEAHFYQIELKRTKIVLMGEEHKKIIVNKEDEREHFKLLQKISYMKADRLSNYSLVLSVASRATNVVSVLITILDNASDANFQRMFALEIDSVNAIVAAVFMVASVCFFIADIVVQLRIDPKILETNIQAKIPYSTENYDALCSQYEKEMNKSGFFSRNILDWARGVYEYNNDVMVRKYCRGEDVYIPYKCMATVESLYPGRVPRYKLMVLILWLCAFMALVWGEANIKYLFSITVMAFVIYDVLLILNAVQLWNSKHEWIHLEEKIEKTCSYRLRKEVKWDFIKYLWGHSVIMILIVAVNGILKMSGNIPKSWFGMLALIVFYCFIGFSFVKKNMLIGDGDILKPYLTVGVFGTGIAAIILSGVFQGKWNDVFVSGIMILGLLAFEEVIASFYRRWRRNTESSTVQFPIGIIFIIMNWGISYIFMIWDLKIIGNNGFEIFIWICVEWIIVLFCRMFWGMIQMGEVLPME